MDITMKVCLECMTDAMQELRKETGAAVTHINDYDSNEGFQPGTCERCEHETDSLHRLAILN